MTAYPDIGSDNRKIFMDCVEVYRIRHGATLPLTLADIMPVQARSSPASPRTGQGSTLTAIDRDRGTAGHIKGDNPQGGGGCMNHSALRDIYGLNQYWT